jgi:Uma2 family endonuclease
MWIITPIEGWKIPSSLARYNTEAFSLLEARFMQQRSSLSETDDPRLDHLPAFPTMHDLPSEDLEEPGLPDDYHDIQPQLLSRTLKLSGYGEQEIYTASDLNLYYDLSHPLWYKRPDWFLVVGVPLLHSDGEGDRDSYVIWQEKVSPAIVVEFLSLGTEAEDLGRFSPKPPKPHLANSPPSKFTVYEQILKVPHYIVFNKRDRHLRYFQLTGGAYQEQPVSPSNPRIWVAGLEIGLAIWHGTFVGRPKAWLRWCDANGNLLLTDTEVALLKLRQTVLNLNRMGMAIAQIAEITGISEDEVEAIVQSSSPTPV